MSATATATASATSLAPADPLAAAAAAAAAVPPLAPVALLDFNLWLQALGQAGVWVELALLAGCVALALALVWGLRRGFKPDKYTSIWFGRSLIDGVLFPALLLTLAYGARAVHEAMQQDLVVFRFAIPVLLALVAIRLNVKVLQVAFKDAAWLRPLERSISWGAWLAVVLWISGLLPLLLHELDQISWTLGSVTISVRTLIEGALSAALVLIVVLWISSAIETRLLRQAAGEDLSLRKAGANALRALLLFVGLIFSMSAVGIDLTALSVLGGAIGVGIGFGLQRLAANYVSGFVILTERSMRIGDMIRVDNFEGRVSDIKARFTVIRSLGGRESIVPNEMLLTNRVENLSLADPQVWQSTVVNVDYSSDVAVVARILEDAALQHERVLRDPPPRAMLTAFAADRLEFTLGYWIADPENGPLGLRSSINMAILAAFRAQGINIPFPQRVLHLKPAQAAEGVPVEFSPPPPK